MLCYAYSAACQAMTYVAGVHPGEQPSPQQGRGQAHPGERGRDGHTYTMAQARTEGPRLS